MMEQNLAKREEARRVWRLNKKEGVPVLEALEASNISKDTYYSYKREYESEWEDNLLTAKDIEERLEELNEELRDLRESADLVEDRMERAEEMTEGVEKVDEALAAAADAEMEVKDVQMQLDRIEEELGVTINASTGSVLSVGDVAQRVEDLGEIVKPLVDRVESLEHELEEEKQRRKDSHERMREQIKEAGSGSLF